MIRLPIGLRGLGFALAAISLLKTLSLLAVGSQAQDPNAISLDPHPPILSQGDVLTLRGKQRFNRGQLNNLTFFIGPLQIAPGVIDANTVTLTVPNLSSGTYSVRVIKHADRPGRDRVEFSENIEIGGEQILSTVTGEIPPTGGRLELPEVASVELGEDTTRPIVTLSIEQVLARSETPLFQGYLASEDLPTVSVDTLIRILVNARIDSPLALHVKVPDAILGAITSDVEPELYAEIPSINEHEDIGEFRPLNAEYDAETGGLIAPFAPSYFSEIETPTTPNALAEARLLQVEAWQFSGRIRISVRSLGVRRAPVEANTVFPATPMFDAGAHETLTLAAHLKIHLPISLINPTTHGGERSPTVTGPFSPKHGGLDLRSRDGDPIYAAADGVVTRIFDNVLPGQPRCNPNVQRGGGWSIVIEHSDGSRTSYSHLIRGSEMVSIGTAVTAGSQIALADHTGGTCPSGPGGAHLHLGFRIDGLVIDPLPYIQLDPENFRQQWLGQLSVMAVVNGRPVSATQRRVTTDEFEYSAALDLGRLDLEHNRTYPISLRLVSQDGQFVSFYNGRIRILPDAFQVDLLTSTDGESGRTRLTAVVRDPNGVIVQVPLQWQWRLRGPEHGFFPNVTDTWADASCYLGVCYLGLVWEYTPESPHAQSIDLIPREGWYKHDVWLLVRAIPRPEVGLTSSAQSVLTRRHLVQPELPVGKLSGTWVPTGTVSTCVLTIGATTFQCGIFASGNNWGAYRPRTP